MSIDTIAPEFCTNGTGGYRGGPVPADSERKCSDELSARSAAHGNVGKAMRDGERANGMAKHKLQAHGRVTLTSE